MFVTGTMMNYYFTCPRKLWYFSHQITMENQSELVELGKLLHESTYLREEKEISIGPIKIDFIDNQGIIHEIKKSAKMEKAHIWQLKYYIWFLSEMGIRGLSGELNYPKLRKTETVYLEADDTSKISEIIDSIHHICQSEDCPEVLNKAFCQQCSYYELCYIE